MQVAPVKLCLLTHAYMHACIPVAAYIDTDLRWGAYMDRLLHTWHHSNTYAITRDTEKQVRYIFERMGCAPTDTHAERQTHLCMPMYHARTYVPGVHTHVHTHVQLGTHVRKRGDIMDVSIHIDTCKFICIHTHDVSKTPTCTYNTCTCVGVWSTCTCISICTFTSYIYTHLENI